MEDSELVYSTDPERNKKCPRCKKLVPECVCDNIKMPGGPFTAVLRIEKAGRGGKTVTVIDKLPRHLTFVEELAKMLKQKCGAGGSAAIREGFGVVEIQGDARERIREIFEKEKIPFKG